MYANELGRFVEAKHFRSTFEVLGSCFEVVVETPDLSDAETSTWGDWGPMYDFAFEQPRAVRVTVQCPDASIENEFEISVHRVRLESPMLFHRRQQHPLCVRIDDLERGVTLMGYLDEQGRPAALELEFALPGSEAALQLLDHQPRRAA